MIVHAALGLPLCGHAMVKSKVLVLCGENPDDVRLRILAVCSEFGHDPAALEGLIFFTKLPFAIDSQFARNAFISEAARLGPFDLLIIDTGPAHSSADDENDNRQAHELAASIRLLMDALGNPATIALMHPPKGASRDTVGTSRGGGAFSGSVDGLCGVWLNDGVLEFFHCSKFRGPGYSPMHFRLVQHQFEEIRDNFGEATISVVAVPTEEKPRAKTFLSRSDRIALDALADCLKVAIPPPPTVLDSHPTCGGHTLFPPVRVAPEALWRERFYAANTLGTQDAKKKAFSRSRVALLNLALINASAGYFWLPSWCSTHSPEP
jgi:hypothetical protein